MNNKPNNNKPIIIQKNFGLQDYTKPNDGDKPAKSSNNDNARRRNNSSKSNNK